MVVCIDLSGVTYSVLAGLTNNVTGSMFLSTLVISFILITILLGCHIPIEISMIILLPLHLAFLACLGGEWLGFVGVILIYLGILLGKNMFFK